MDTIEKDFTAVGASRAMHVQRGRQISYAVAGTFVGTVLLETSRNGGASWETLETITGAASGVKRSAAPTGGGALFRFRCKLFTSGTIETSIVKVAKVIVEYKDSNGVSLFKVTEEGVTLRDAVSTAGAVEAESFAGVDGGAVRLTQGDDAGASAIDFGAASGEGLQIKTLEETVSLVAAGAKFVELTTPLPAGAVILSAQANIEALVVAGGTTVKVGLGLSGGDVDKYGLSATFAKNQKLGGIPAVLEPLAAPEQLAVCGVVTNGSALGDSNFTAGSVRVRITYLEMADLVDAA